MANGVVVQFAVPSALTAIAVCLFVVYMKRKTQREPSYKIPQVEATLVKSETVQPAPAQIAASRKPPEAERQVPRTTTMEVAITNGPRTSVANVSLNSTAPKPTVVHEAQPVPVQEDRNQRILASISENIRKSLIKPVPAYSPIHYPVTPRDTEYVRVKKQIITPHGQIRFSILKDSISANMLAVFRRASMEWKTPDDLIGFLPAYLEPEAEVLDNQVLLIGTAGHNEKLAIPIRSVDANSSFRDCFDFVTDVPTATNTPAVVLASDTEFEVVSRGVITRPVFIERVERSRPDLNLLVEQSLAALQTSNEASA